MIVSANDVTAEKSNNRPPINAGKTWSIPMGGSLVGNVIDKRENLFHFRHGNRFCQTVRQIWKQLVKRRIRSEHGGCDQDPKQHGNSRENHGGRNKMVIRQRAQLRI